MEFTLWIFAHLLGITGFLLAIVLIPRILLERRHPGATMAWILAIALVPYVGVPLYFLIGGKRIEKVSHKRGWLVVESEVIPEEVALLLLTVLSILSYMGGVTMIVGGILHIVGAPPFMANFFISLGSGVSVLNLIINLILTAPAIKARIISMLFLELLDASTPFILSVLAMLLVYLSIVDDVRGFIMMMIAGILTNLSGAMVDVKVLKIMFSKIGMEIPPQMLKAQLY